ncbi:MAG: hypothetical protein ACJ786_01675, partial [Catenulispora sp.]
MLAIAVFAIAVVLTRPGAPPSDKGSAHGSGHETTPFASSVPGEVHVPSTPTAPKAPPAPSTATDPVDQALADLSGEPMLHYSGVSPDGGAAWDLIVTAGGQAQGDLDLGGRRLGVLRVGGRTYFKAADASSAELLGRLPNGTAASSVRGRWITGDNALESSVPADLPSPPELADSLQSAVQSQRTGSLSPPASASTTGMGAEPATAVPTPAGVLFISTAEPFRMLRFVPASASGPGSLTTPGAGSATDARPTDVETVSQADANGLFSDLIDQTRTLTDAVDVGIAFSYRADPGISCSADLCAITQSDVTVSAADPRTARPGSVVAAMTAQVALAGRPAGGC